jgi:hypothetical protein
MLWRTIVIQQRLHEDDLLGYLSAQASSIPSRDQRNISMKHSRDRLAPLLQEAGALENGIEVVFWGTEGEIELHDAIRNVKFKQNFARSMSLADAADPKNILCYEMNGAPLPAQNRFPLRLIAPG